MSRMAIWLVENTTAFAGVAIGIMNAQLVLKTAGSMIKMGAMFRAIAMDANRGMSKAALAALLINSVIIDTEMHITSSIGSRG